jgi:hypothetical protein
MISPARTSARSTQKPIAAPKKKGAHPLRDAPLQSASFTGRAEPTCTA